MDHSKLNHDPRLEPHQRALLGTTGHGIEDAENRYPLAGPGFAGCCRISGG